MQYWYLHFIESGQYDDYILDIKTLFKGVGDNDYQGEVFYYIPQPGALENILKKIRNGLILGGIETWQKY